MQSWLTLHHLWECFKLLLFSDFCSLAKTTAVAYFQNWIPRIVENVQKFLIWILFSVQEQFSSIDREFIFWVCLVTIHYRYFFSHQQTQASKEGKEMQSPCPWRIVMVVAGMSNLSCFPNICFGLFFFLSLSSYFTPFHYSQQNPS